MEGRVGIGRRPNASGVLVGHGGGDEDDQSHLALHETSWSSVTPSPYGDGPRSQPSSGGPTWRQRSIEDWRRSADPDFEVSAAPGGEGGVDDLQLVERAPHVRAQLAPGPALAGDGLVGTLRALEGEGRLLLQLRLPPGCLAELRLGRRRLPGPPVLQRRSEQLLGEGLGPCIAMAAMRPWSSSSSVARLAATRAASAKSASAPKTKATPERASSASPGWGRPTVWPWPLCRVQAYA
jgi:hypothetical protein